jgi:Tfp pilus assembly protein PilV
LTPEHSSDLGLSMIEVLVAVFVLAIVLIPLMRVVVDTVTATSGARLEEEASNLASSRIETVEQLATQGPLSLGTTTSSTKLGGDTFTVGTSVQALNGTGQSLCTGADGPNQLAIWRVKTTVSWANMGGVQPVVESTEVQPGANAPSRLDAAEVALPLVNADGTTFDQPVSYQVNVTPVGTTQTPTLPADATGSFDDGCVALEDLPAAPSGAVYEYTITLTPKPGIVSSSEYSDSYPGGPPTIGFNNLQKGRLLVLPPVYLAEGVQASVAFKTQTFAGGASAVAPAADLPVTVAPAGASQSHYIFGNGTTDITSMLLYPYASYSAWAGETPESAPGWQVSGSPVYPGAAPATQIAVAGPGATTSVTLPVYPLTVQVSNAGKFPGATLTATEVDALSLPFTLNPVDGSGTSVTGLPLGQYVVTSSGGALTATSPAYVWVTPTGVWTSSSQMPMAGPPASPDTSIGSGADVVAYQ